MDVQVGLDAAGVYWEDLAHFLATQGVTVSMVNRAQLKASAACRLVRTKIDAVDARLLAACCAERPPPWPPRSAAEVALQAYVLRLDARQTRHTQESNRLGVATEVVRTAIQEPLEWLEQPINILIQTINQHIESHSDLKGKRALLASIPGCGEHTIALLLAFYADPSRVANSRQAAAFAGLDPRQHESGSSLKATPRLSKVGHAFLRQALDMPAMVTWYQTDWGQQFQARLALSGEPAKLIIGARMRKLLHAALGVLKSGNHCNPALHGA